MKFATFLNCKTYLWTRIKLICEYVDLFLIVSNLEQYGILRVLLNSSYVVK